MSRFILGYGSSNEGFVKLYFVPRIWTQLNANSMFGKLSQVLVNQSADAKAKHVEAQSSEKM